MDVAQRAGPGQLPDKDKVTHVAPLGAALEDAGVAAHGIGNRAAFGDGHTERFFTIDILSRARGQHGNQGMVVVARGDHDGVDVGLGNQFAHVNVSPAILVAVTFVHHLFGGFAPVRDNIAHGDHLDVGILQKRVQDVIAPAADTDGANRDAFACRRLRSAGEEVMRKGKRACGARTLEHEGTSCNRGR
ncbi:MAG: hypothetical protein BWX80_00608 [Candidatus Hydrogenedentes bacterium ADurb.Bin101]|nr:MAG: hypothetical protein BWX80_00608 [Candidatus Hydrogenedentes bacterium ADurb.Bin101]